VFGTAATAAATAAAAVVAHSHSKCGAAHCEGAVDVWEEVARAAGAGAAAGVVAGLLAISSSSPTPTPPITINTKSNFTFKERMDRTANPTVGTIPLPALNATTIPEVLVVIEHTDTPTAPLATAIINSSSCSTTTPAATTTELLDAIAPTASTTTDPTLPAAAAPPNTNTTVLEGNLFFKERVRGQQQQQQQTTSTTPELDVILPMDPTLPAASEASTNSNTIVLEDNLLFKELVRLHAQQPCPTTELDAIEVIDPIPLAVAASPNSNLSTVTAVDNKGSLLFKQQVHHAQQASQTTAELDEIRLIDPTSFNITDPPTGDGCTVLEA
jgi:hypothetical protein